MKKIQTEYEFHQNNKGLMKITSWNQVPSVLHDP